jgi:hypothetical protein
VSSAARRVEVASDEAGCGGRRGGGRRLAGEGDGGCRRGEFWMRGKAEDES